MTHRSISANSKAFGLKIAILSIPEEDWGGSEELWGRSIPHLQGLGYTITVIKNRINRAHPEFVKLAQRKVELLGLLSEGRPEAAVSKPTNRFFSSYGRKVRNLISRSRLCTSATEEEDDPWTKCLRQVKPDFVIISQGINFDGLLYAYRCGRLGIPYSIVAQKAVDFYWPLANERQFMRDTLLKARQVFFVSQHNHRLTEEQFGMRLSNAQVISNPVKVSRQPIPYPSTLKGYNLACIARLFVLDKGQDMLIRILAKEKWKSRPLTVTLVGSGVDADGLQAMADLLEVNNLKFCGQVDDMESFWEEYHALVLPSRSEGLPLSMVEAMAAGRAVIISKAGGNAELVEEGVTGFIGHANEESFEEALERAWNRRDSWQAMGINASAHINKVVPPLPELEFAKQISQDIRASTPLVSVIIPTYNREGAVKSAIESVLNQTYHNVQLIVIDDGSQDNTAEVVKKYSKAEYYWQMNGGQASARNRGLAHAKGSIIASLDSDDTWEPDFLMKCVSKIEDDQLDFVFANWSQGTKGEGKFDFLRNYPDLQPHLKGNGDGWNTISYPDLRRLYLSGCPSPSSSIVMRRSSMVSGWTPSINIGDDWCLLLSIILSKECRVAFTTEKLWHKHVNSINLYDGRLRIDIVKLLYIEDMSEFMRRFSDLLTKNEMLILRNMYTLGLVEHAKHSLVRELNIFSFSLLLMRSMLTDPLLTLRAFPSLLAKGAGRHLKAVNK